MSSGLRGAVVIGLLAILLAACSSSDDDEIQSGQKYYFLESLAQVEAGGRQLQTAGLDRQSLTEALARLDQGLQLAFQVDRKFLDQLDLRLGKNYQRYFVRGVENYRIGIEAGDEAQQREGLRLLSQWAEFWQAEQVIVCINRRLGMGQGSCAASGGLDLIDTLPAMIAVERLEVPVARRECLGRCKTGPVMRIAPGGPFFTEIDATRLVDIIAQLKSFIEIQHADRS